MTANGGLRSHELIHVSFLDHDVTQTSIKNYSISSISEIPKNYFKNGFSIIIIPGFSHILQHYADHVWEWPGLFNQPLVGWVSGHDLNEKNQTPLVFNGQTGEVFSDHAVVFHAEIQPHLKAQVNIINIFNETNSDVICFNDSGFEAKKAIVNGREVDFADYLIKSNVDIKWPVVADFNGENINVSFRELNETTKTVQFYVPVFKGIEYKLAKPINIFEDKFEKSLLAKNIQKTTFSCNCVLNFFHAHLEGKKMGSNSFAMTFGEIAFLLLNQTYVYMTIDSKK